jgi:uncharacterized protein
VGLNRFRGGAAARGLVLAAVVFAAAVAEIAIPPSPSRWATDKAGFLSASVLSALDARLEAFERREGHQVLVYIDKTTGGTPLEDFAVKAFAAWKVGRKGLDDGLVLFIMSADRKIRIEVGYGLEDKVTDARAFQVIDSILTPRLRAGEQDAAVPEAVNALLGYITGVRSDEADVAPAGASSGQRRSGAQIPPAAIIIGGILFLVILVTNPRLAFGILRFLLYMALSGGGGGRGGGGGGSFGGGGGRSGGGGASGGW